MVRKTRRRLIAVLVWCAVTPLLVELALQVFDPWGIGPLSDALYVLESRFVPDAERGYTQAPGEYHLSRWKATILTDGSRRVPDTNLGSPCKIVLLGDSATFGQSVSDEETWASLVAAKLPQAHLINTGVIGYALDNVLGVYRAHPDADAYIYLMIANDAEPGLWLDKPLELGHVSYLYNYLQMLRARPDAPATDNGFLDKIGALFQDSRVMVAGFDTVFSHHVQARYPSLKIIPYFTHVVSRADGHANQEGNREIAAAILPIVKQAVQEHCTATF